MFREQDIFDRELFVDSTRSVSVVLGEKDNKSVNQNILKSAIHANHLLMARTLNVFAFFGTSFLKKVPPASTMTFMLLSGSEEENKRSATGGAA